MRILAYACAALTLAGCFAPDYPPCAYQCGAFNGSHCPDNYTCQADGYCHLNGSTAKCEFPTTDGGKDAPVPDLAMGDILTMDDIVMSGDMAMSGDLAVEEDMAMMTPADMTMAPDLGPEPPDMTLPPDMTDVPDMTLAADLTLLPDLSPQPDLTVNQCADTMKNGNETDTDCGGGTCPTCGNGKICAMNSDCTTGNCMNLKCMP